MKNIFFYLMAALGFLFNLIEAAENPSIENFIPLHAINNTWPQKTQLDGIIIYKNKEEKEFSLIFDEVTGTSPQKSINLPYGSIEKIELYLFNHYGKDDEYPCDEDGKKLQGTLITQTVFEPSPSSLKEITFTIKSREIIPNPIYDYPPKFNDNQ
jgi:hypothetical protein